MGQHLRIAAPLQTDDLQFAFFNGIRWRVWKISGGIPLTGSRLGTAAALLDRGNLRLNAELRRFW